MNGADNFSNDAGIHIQVGNDAINDFVDYVISNCQHIVIVTDENTYQALGCDIERALQEKSGTPHFVILQEEDGHLSADAKSILNLLTNLDSNTERIVAVGSGTITDIVRFVAYKTKLPFISIPTAASVDAFASFTTFIMVEGVKHSYQAKQPEAIFVSIDTLRNAPSLMTAAGFGDMLAKYTALADWKLAHLLVGEPYDAEIAEAIEVSLKQCADKVQEISTHSEIGIQTLIEGLIVSGFCMAKTKNSRPASGSEHSLSHYWEITHSKDDPPPSLHGVRTGLATSLIVELYEKIRSLSQEEVIKRLKMANFPDPSSEKAGLNNLLGDIGKDIGSYEFSFLGMSQATYQQLIEKVLTHWDQIIKIAAEVPTREKIVSYLHQANLSSVPQEIGISEEKLEQALRWGSYLRPRFTVLELCRILSRIA